MNKRKHSEEKEDVKEEGGRGRRGRNGNIYQNRGKIEN